MARKKTYKRKDHFYEKAKREGLPSRAAFKLEEILDKYPLLKANSKVLDLGCWPGGWLKVLGERVSLKSLIVGIDLNETPCFGFDQVKTIVGDIFSEEVLQSAVDMASGEFDLVLSDLSPKLTGIKEQDVSNCLDLHERVLEVCRYALISGGALVMKVFKNQRTEEFVKSLNPVFNRVTRFELESTRKSSNEFYVIASGFKRSCLK